MNSDGEELLAQLCAAFDATFVPVVSAAHCGDRSFEFEIRGDLSDEQESEIVALCEREQVRIDLHAPNQRMVVDRRSASL
ncbi:MAG TPA: hypothetical protein VN636_00530 [Acidimicrobiia bacterium]|nr:hypothetical protein [Acidimicrobiia bacterium]